jgi:hypothetical protein
MRCPAHLQLLDVQLNGLELLRESLRLYTRLLLRFLRASSQPPYDSFRDLQRLSDTHDDAIFMYLSFT